MKHLYRYRALLLFLVAILLTSSCLHAQAIRTWVSGVGDDANPCSRTAPCKTFAGAISKTAEKGEISVLDPAGYGVVTITKSIIINGNNMLAGITSSGTNAIIINAGADDAVTIRGISINGFGTGPNGIRYLAGGQVHIDDCTITGITGSGIVADLSTKGVLTIKNTMITAPDTNFTGVNVKTTSGAMVQVMLSNVHIQGIGTAIRAQDNAVVNVSNCIISNNTIGVLSEKATSIVRLSNVSLMGNSTGVGAGSGKVYSLGNNSIIGNQTTNPISVLSNQ